MVICGMGGAGKTTTAAHAPGAFFFRDALEGGIVVARERKMVPADVGDLVYTSWEDLLEKVALFAKRKHDYQTLVLDATTGIQRAGFDWTCEHKFGNDMDRFNDYSKGPKNFADKYFPAILDGLLECQDAGINIIIIAHSVVKPYKNPDGPDFDTYIPDLEAYAWQRLYRWVEASIFIHNQMSVEEERGRKTRKAAGNYDKLCIVDWSPKFMMAKNWYKVAGPLECGESAEEAWANIAEAFGY
jgi:hypothetical protein